MRLGSALMFALAAGLLGLPAAAAPLDKEACEKIKADHAAMATAKDHLAKGPEWAKANLSKDQLKDVERYIQMEEQIAFRCVVRKPPVEAAAKAPPRAKVKRAAKAEAGEATADPAQEAPAKAAATPAPKPKPAPKLAAPAQQSGATAEPIAGKAAPAPAPVKKAPAPKPKVNDAYVPPPATSTPTVKQ